MLGNDGKNNALCGAHFLTLVAEDLTVGAITEKDETAFALGDQERLIDEPAIADSERDERDKAEYDDRTAGLHLVAVADEDISHQEHGDQSAR